ncbi:alpha/beta fold hydrolase [Streptosporangium lutulentum]
MYGLLSKLGLQHDIRLVGHDIGTMVSYAYAAAHPGDVTKLVLSEAPIPDKSLYTFSSLTPKGPGFWNFGFFSVTNGLPERMVNGKEELWVERFTDMLEVQKDGVDNKQVREYARFLRDDAHLRASFEWFRAFPKDVADNAEYVKKKLRMPVLAIGAAAPRGLRPHPGPQVRDQRDGRRHRELRPLDLRGAARGAHPAGPHVPQVEPIRTVIALPGHDGGRGVPRGCGAGDRRVTPDETRRLPPPRAPVPSLRRHRYPHFSALGRREAHLHPKETHHVRELVFAGHRSSSAEGADAPDRDAGRRRADGRGRRPVRRVRRRHSGQADGQADRGAGARRVRRRLKLEQGHPQAPAGGYPVIAPANPLRDLNGDSAYVSSVLSTIPGPVILVGHSYGGEVISNAAVGHPNVKALVYIAAFVPDEGESGLDLTGKYPGSLLPTSLITREFPLPGGGTGTDAYVDAAKFRAAFAADLPAATPP